ncbi:MAG TPA: pilus assembly PilX N-terminal domain-containing protein, partial [Gemmatimonadales bacterium]|nr:pilus assembly PilX N-terminal domain-containing protein [Gemmatimonadales bacterium]
MKNFPSDSGAPRGQHGAVLPLAMLILLVLSAVLLGLATLTGQEPLAARNHALVAQAQGMAEAGLDRALWALSTPGAVDGVAWAAPVPAPYDGSRLIDVTVDGLPLGAFRLAISGSGDRQRQVVVTGLAPGMPGQLGQARQDVSATAIRLRFPAVPAGLTVRGDLEIGPG